MLASELPPWRHVGHAARAPALARAPAPAKSPPATHPPPPRTVTRRYGQPLFSSSVWRQQLRRGRRKTLAAIPAEEPVGSGARGPRPQKPRALAAPSSGSAPNATLVKHRGISYVVALLGCIEPPLECPSQNVTFWLYTRANENSPHQLLASDPETLESAPWVLDAPVKIIIHGYTGDKDGPPSEQLRPAYMNCCDYNLISVDYSEIAKSPCYIEAARNTELVGKCTAQLIDTMVANYSVPLDLFHIIGFSLGGETAGYIADYLTSGTLPRITALDPALPLFVTLNKSRKIDASDATMVDALHTNALLAGKLERVGKVDFYANGGFQQPGCFNLNQSLVENIGGCSHGRAPEYFGESITTDVGFYGYKCPSLGSLSLCEPDSAEDLLFGEYMPLNSSGLYFFETNSEPPFARGPRT